ncbi:MAG: thiamine phosphate synthase [Vulcanimicrobiaceae bacterium]
MMNHSCTLSGIYAILGDGTRDPVALSALVLEAGVRIVQYRAKSGINVEHLRAIRSLTRTFGARLIVNDDWDAARRFDADGVHLGPEDCQAADLPTVRRALGDRFLGISCGTGGEATMAAAARADYIGVGPVFETGSKRDAGAPLGVGGLLRVAAATTLPVAAIGGINLRNVAEVARTGIAMAAVLSALGAAEDPGAVARELIAAWRSP